MAKDKLKILKLLYKGIQHDGRCDVQNIFHGSVSCSLCPMYKRFCNKFDGVPPHFHQRKMEEMAKYIRILELKKMEDLLREK